MDNPPGQLLLCAACSKPMTVKGSMTAWLFRESRCDCLHAPDVKLGEAGPKIVDAGNVQCQDLAPLKERYRILDKLGEGGMGAVCKALDLSVDCFVAMKILHPHLSQDSAAVLRFKTEAESMTGMRHKNLVGVIDSGITGEGLPFLVMDFLDGQTLQEFIAGSPAFSRDELLEIVLQLCDGLAYLHENRVIHRDLKPSNIIICRSQNEILVKIVDFGIAKVAKPLGANSDFEQLTRTGELVGSPAYMSPEQCQGLVLTSVSDIYSLGCLMYFMVTGRPPFQGDNPVQVIVKHLQDKVPKIPRSQSVPIDLESIIQNCLAKDPKIRYQSASELKADLINFRDGRPLNKRRRSFGAFAAIKVLVLSSLLILVVSIGIYFGAQRAQQPVFGEWHQLDLAGQELFDQAKLVDAKNSFQRALEIARQMKRKDLILSSLNELLDLSRADGPSEDLKMQAVKWRNELEILNRNPMVEGVIAELNQFLSEQSAVAPKDGTSVNLCARANDIAGSLIESGQYDLAESVLNKTMGVAEAFLANDHLVKIRCLHNLGYLYHSRGDVGRSVDFYKRALAIQRRTLPTADPMIGTTLLALGRAYGQSGLSLSDERKYLDEATAQFRKTYGPNSKQVSLCHYQLALHFMRAQNNVEAEKEVRAAVAILEAGQLVDSAELAQCYNLLGQLTGQRQYLFQALRIIENKPLKDYSVLSESMLGLGRLTVNQDPQVALDYLPRIRAISNRLSVSQRTYALSKAAELENYALKKLPPNATGLE